MTLQLRPYQLHAIDAVEQYLREHDDNPCVVIPTAGGKTLIIAEICKTAVEQRQQRVCILAHVKELLEQTIEKLRIMCPGIHFGVYSSGLRRRDTSNAVIVASIQSVYQRVHNLGAFDLAIIDEAHLIPIEGYGMYRQFLAKAKAINPKLRMIGFTATPFRLKDGPICAPDNFLNTICYEVGVRELMHDGYLCKLVTKAGIHKADCRNLHVRAGEFIPAEVEALMDNDHLVEAACNEIVHYTQNRNGVLIFASGIHHGQHIVQQFANAHHVECGLIIGSMNAAERDATLTRFRRGELKYLCNVNVLTTGFDAPHVDCVVLLRPTMSRGLYYQMVGRGFRVHPNKHDCLILDYGGNVLRHGPVDQLAITNRRNKNGEAPAKECPECRALIAISYTQCPDCGYEFPRQQRYRHDAVATEAGILSDQAAEITYEVREITYRVHTKRNAAPGAPQTMRVDYRVGLAQWCSEWICFEHSGFAKRKAIQWWRLRCRDPVPATAAEAVALARAGRVTPATSITVRYTPGEKYPRVVDYQLATVSHSDTLFV